MTILLIGFEAPESQDSASATVLSAVMERQNEAWGERVGTALLRVQKGTIQEMHEHQSQQLVELIFEFRPDTVVFVGQAAGRSKMTLERLAVNYFMDQRIVDEGPAAYWQTLPHFDTWPKQFADAGLALGLSNFAGSNMTNHVLYSALHLANTEKLPLRAGLFHLPLLKEQCVDELEGQPSVIAEEAASSLIFLVERLLDHSESD